MQRDHYPQPKRPLSVTEPTLHFTPCDDAASGHRMAWWQWGDAAASRVVVCVHGLTRQGRDFDALARALLGLADGPLRVVCPDVVGRGRSDWLREPAGYQVPQYSADLCALLGHLQRVQPIATLDYVGTSMGGLIGMVLAGNRDLPLPAPIRRLVLNDVGPALDPQALRRIGAYVGQGGRYASRADAAAALWSISSTFGPHSEAQWAALSHHMVVPASDAGDWKLHYDPAIAVPLRGLTAESMVQAEAVVWALYDAITADTLLLRGAQSDLLARPVALAMTQRGPRARLVEFDGVGHAPTLVAPDQHGAVASFLFAP